MLQREAKEYEPLENSCSRFWNPEALLNIPKL